MKNTTTSKESKPKKSPKAAKAQTNLENPTDQNPMNQHTDIVHDIDHAKSNAQNSSSSKSKLKKNKADNPEVSVESTPEATKKVAKPRAKKATESKEIKEIKESAQPTESTSKEVALKVKAEAKPKSSTKSAKSTPLTIPSAVAPIAVHLANSENRFSHSTLQKPVTTMNSPVFKKDPKLADNWKTKSVEELTDAEVLAMPDEAYMNDVQLAFFRLKLSKLKRDMLANAGETTEHLREETIVVPDPADRATIEEEHALELRTRDRERKLLKKIEQSILSIDAGDYGYCDETGEPIGVARLLARPTATLSLEAQQRRELKQKMFGD